MYYKISEVSQLLGVHTQTIRRWEKEGKCIRTPSGHRRTKGSRNRSRVKITRLHRSIANTHSDFLHKITTNLARKHRIVVIENLNIWGMMRNRKLSLAIADVGWGEFARQLKYKCEWYGSTRVIVPCFFLSSKLCSHSECIKHDLSLSDRVYSCANCGLKMDRDVNATLNLKKYGDMYFSDLTVAASWTETLNACGEHVRPSDGTVSYGSLPEGDVCEA